MNLLHLGRPGIFVKSSRISNPVKKVLLQPTAAVKIVGN